MRSIGNRLALMGGVAASVLFASSAFATEPAPAAAPLQRAEQLAPLPPIDIQFTKFTLSNGLTLIVHEDHKAPIVAVNTWYHVGSKNEPTARSGFAHLFEHLMFNGSENFNNDFIKATELLGATDQNGTTNTDRTNYFQNVPTSALDAMLWLESDRMGHLAGAIDQARLDEQRGVVQNEKRQRENQPYGRVWNAITEATYPADHPYGHSVIGSMDDLNAADLDTVKAWFRDYYGPANATIVLAGDITPEEARAKVEKYFGDIPPGPPVTHPNSMIAPMVGRQSETMYDRVAQPRIYKVWNTPEAGTADNDYLRLLGQVLSSGRNSRLYKRLVFDDQIAVGVSASQNAQEIGSQFMVMVTAKPGQDLGRIEAIIDEEMTRLLREGPTALELERARTVQGAGLVRGAERIGGFGGKSDLLAQSQVYHGDPNAWKTSYERVLAAQGSDLTQTGRRWLSDGSYSLAVLPFPEYAAAATGVDRSLGVPATGAVPAASFPQVQHATLSNGLKVILAPRNGVPTVAMSLIVNAGSVSDEPGKGGIAALTPTVMANGTDTLNALEISDRAQVLGASLTYGTGVDYTSVGINALTTRLEPTLGLFADVIQNPAFRPADFTRAQALQVAAIQQSNRDPGAIAFRVLAADVFGPETPYGRRINGTEASVATLTPADAEAYHAVWFRPDNATLVVVGDTSLAELQPQLERAFATWKAPATPLPVKPELPIPQTPAQPRVLLVNRPGPQAMIVAGRLTAPFDAATEPVQDAFNMALGGGFTSRINMNLREDKHWSYGAYSGVDTGHGPRLFYAQAGVQSDKTAESTAEVHRELTEVVTRRPVSSAELTAVKANLIQGMAGNWETNAAVMGELRQMVVYGRPENYYDDYAVRVNATTTASAAEAARAVVGSGPTSWVIVGDAAAMKPKIEALNIGPVQVVDVNGVPVP